MSFREDFLNAYAEGLKDPAGYTKTYSGILIPTEKSPEAEDISIKCYEMQGSPIAQFMQNYRDKAEKEIFDQMDKDLVDTPHGKDIIYEQLVPRVKWFRPPLTLKIWKFEFDMTWAYKVEKTYLLKNCYPKSMGIIEGMDVSKAGDPPKEITFNWNCTPVKSPEVEAKAEKLRKSHGTSTISIDEANQNAEWEVRKNPNLENILRSHKDEIHQQTKDQEERIRGNWPDAKISE